ncbi:hypothetical protein NDU88_001311 [Pleurodeles waltl]|uniref:Uncharacterized protein n=1 Tax=Pleurodeles waltl TaxID=8319 RepID=A0AAV7SCM0_PLEWA|nr:hypothetical protein NDU88_001311 [Pleurodeles waltl]
MADYPGTQGVWLESGAWSAIVEKTEGAEEVGGVGNSERITSEEEASCWWSSETEARHPEQEDAEGEDVPTCQPKDKAPHQLDTIANHAPEGAWLFQGRRYPASPGDNEQYPRGALQHADVTSVDTNPEVNKDADSTERTSLCEEEVVKPKEPERTDSTTSTGERRKEPTNRVPRGEPSSSSDWTGVRASHVPGGTWLTQTESLANLEISTLHKPGSTGLSVLENSIRLKMLCGSEPNVDCSTEHSPFAQNTSSLKDKNCHLSFILTKVVVYPCTPYPLIDKEDKEKSTYLCLRFSVILWGPTTERRSSHGPLQTKREGNSKEIADPEKGKEEKRIEKKEKKRRD